MEETRSEWQSAAGRSLVPDHIRAWSGVSTARQHRGRPLVLVRPVCTPFGL